MQTWTGHLCQLRPGDVHSHVSDGVKLLRSTASTSQHPPSHLSRSASVFQSLAAALVLCRLDYGNGTLVGIPAYLVRRLQSMQNAAARLAFRLHRLDHGRTRQPPIDCECPKVLFSKSPCRLIGLSMAMPRSTTAVHTDRRHPVSTDCGLHPTIYSFLLLDCLLLPVGRRAFLLVAGARIWNDLPVDVTSAPSLLIFRKLLKLHLFRLSCANLVFTARCTLVQSAVLRSHVVCLSVKLVNCDHIGWNSSKIIFHH